MNHVSRHTHTPVFPRLLRFPLRGIPGNIHNRIFCYGLNYLFKQELLDEELDFLDDKVVSLSITDAGLKFNFTLDNNKIIWAHKHKVADLTMQGNAYEFLLMLSRKEDPDTLFFNRRLQLSGDTELGLYVKNFLDSLEITERWKYLHLLSDKMRSIAETIG